MTTQTILKQIETLKADYGESLIWGVRYDVAGLPVSHIFDASRVWDDGKPTEETLSGTSVLQETHIACVIGGYCTDAQPTAYIVCGYHAGYGEDAGEIILSECEVIAVAE